MNLETFLERLDTTPPEPLRLLAGNLPAVRSAWEQGYMKAQQEIMEMFIQERDQQA